MLVVSIIILFVLSFQVMPVAVGMDSKNMPAFQLISGILFLVLGQMLLFVLGLWLGSHFMYLLARMKTYVLFIGFFLIAVRFNMEAFKVRKGERTYAVGKKASFYIMPAIAQAMNTFLAGILFYYPDLSANPDKNLIYLAVFSLSLTLLFVFIKNQKQALSVISLLYMIGGGLLMVVSFYFIFV